MPIYEYLCSDCGERIEIKATIEEKEKGLKILCPKCGSDKVQQVYSTFIIGSSKKNDHQSTCGCQG